MSLILIEFYYLLVLNRLSFSSARLMFRTDVPQAYRSRMSKNMNKHHSNRNHLRTAIVLLCTSGFTEVYWHVISRQFSKLLCLLPNRDGCWLSLCFSNTILLRLKYEKILPICPCSKLIVKLQNGE